VNSLAQKAKNVEAIYSIAALVLVPFKAYKIVKPIFFSMALFGASFSEAHAQKSVALVIGIDAYRNISPLEKAVGDADAVAEKFRAMGIEVFVAIDVSQREMNSIISDFTAALASGDTALLFFAGHGVEIDSENYLLPADIEAPNPGDEYFVKSASFALSELLNRVRRKGVRTTIAIIDACRDNPFDPDPTRSTGAARGLGRLSAPEGNFVVYSAGVGQRALDSLGDEDKNKNSVFTRNLLPLLDNPNLELREMVRKLRSAVMKTAQMNDHKQFPAYYDELLGDFYFGKSIITVPDGRVSSPNSVSREPSAEVGVTPSAGIDDTKDGAVTQRDGFLEKHNEIVDHQPFQSASKKEKVDILREYYKDEGPLGLKLVDSVSMANLNMLKTPTEDDSSVLSTRALQEFLKTRNCYRVEVDGVIGKISIEGANQLASLLGFGIELGKDSSGEEIESILSKFEGAPSAFCTARKVKPALTRQIGDRPKIVTRILKEDAGSVQKDDVAPRNTSQGWMPGIDYRNDRGDFCDGWSRHNACE